MKREAYIDLMSRIRSNQKLTDFIIWSNRLTTYVVYVIFIVFMAFLFITKNAAFTRILLTTAISFVIVSVFRKIYNRKRPYEIFDAESVIKKDKEGNSFPSRHVFSAFVIAMACLYINIPLGVIMILISTCIAVLRVVGGVHFISDVVVGALVGIVSGIIGLYIM